MIRSLFRKNFTVEEQDKILLGKKSNNLLDTNRLEYTYNVLSIKKSFRIYYIYIMNRDEALLKLKNIHSKLIFQGNLDQEIPEQIMIVKTY